MKIRILLVTTLLTLSLIAFGQGRDMSEIKSKILQAKSEKDKIEGLIQLGSSFGRQFPDSVLYYRDLLTTSEFTSSELTEAGMLFLNALSSYHSGDLQKAIGELEYSAQKLKEADMLSTYYRNLNLLGVAYNRTREHNQSIKVLSEIINDSPDTEEYMNAKAAAYSNISNAYKRLGEYAEAINALEESLILTELYNMPRAAESRAFAYYNMAQMLLILEQFEEAKKTYLDIELDKVRGQSMKAAILSDLGQTFYKLEAYDSAKLFTEQSLEIINTSRNLQQIVQPSILLSKLFIEDGLFEEALDILKKPTTYCETNRCPPPAIVDLKIMRMDILRQQNKLNEALNAATDFTTYLDDNQINHLSKGGFAIVSDLYEDLGDKENALYYQKLYAEINRATYQGKTNFKEKSEVEQLKTMRAERALAETESEKNLYRYLTLQTGIIAVVLIIIIIYGYRYFTRKTSDGNQAFLQTSDNQSLKIQAPRLLSLKSKAILDIDSITYITSDGPYIEIFIEGKDHPEVDRNTLKNVLEELPQSEFVQIHRSHIVNIKQVKSLYATKVILNDATELNVSRTYKSEVQSKLQISA